MENWKVIGVWLQFLIFACIIMLFIGKRNSGRKGTELVISCTASCFYYASVHDDDDIGVKRQNLTKNSSTTKFNGNYYYYFYIKLNSTEITILLFL